MMNGQGQVKVLLEELGFMKQKNKSMKDEMNRQQNVT
jgi:hypothetical protein